MKSLSEFATANLQSHVISVPFPGLCKGEILCKLIKLNANNISNRIGSDMEGICLDGYETYGRRFFCKKLLLRIGNETSHNVLSQKVMNVYYLE